MMGLNHTTDILVFFMAVEVQLLWMRSGIQNGYGLSKETEKHCSRPMHKQNSPKSSNPALFSIFVIWEA